MELLLGLAIGILLLAIFISVVAAIILIAARIVQVQTPTFSKAVAAAIVGLLLGAFAESVTVALTGIPGFGALIAFLVHAWAVKVMFLTSYLKGLGTVIVAWIVGYLLLFVMVVVLGVPAMLGVG
jgi:hypothetical protein